MLTKTLDKIWEYNPYIGAIVTASICGALIGTAIMLIISLFRIIIEG